jgi:hypothetical protein
MPVIYFQKTAPTAATEVLLGLPPLHLKMEAEAQARFRDSVAANNGRPDPYDMGMRGKYKT